MIPQQHVLPLLLAISMQFSLSACERSPAETASVSPAPPRSKRRSCRRTAKDRPPLPRKKRR